VHTLPVGLDDQELIDALARSWDLTVNRLRYIPKGFGSYHWLAHRSGGRRYFVTVDDLDSKPWLGSDRDSAFEGLQAAFDTARLLHDQVHLPFVVAPIPTRIGDVTLRLTPRYSLAVFPFIEGRAGDFDDPLSSEGREQLLHILAALHLSTPAVDSRARRHGVDLPGRTDLEVALGDLGQPWSGGPFSEPARSQLADKATVVSNLLRRFDDLAVQVDANAEPVITHGEPHPGNLITLQGRKLLVDWDTVALAPPERDLWMLDDGAPDSFAPYSQATGRAIDGATITLYRLSWTLADIAAFVALFRSAHQRNEDTEKAWRALTGTLGQANGGAAGQKHEASSAQRGREFGEEGGPRQPQDR
jgi:spectinomycin phosphotransferase